MKRFDGTMSVVYPQSKMNKLMERSRGFIAQELRKNGFELSDEGVELKGLPIQQREICERLRSGELEYPTSAN